MPLPAPPIPDPKRAVLATEDWIEYRTGYPTLVRKFLFRKVPHTGWFHTLGSSLLTVFILQATTGILLAMSYDPSPAGAYQSIRYITDDQTFGWLIRGMHKWGASVMVILLFLHMGRTFFYGAYKYPREMTWLTGSLIFLSVMGMGLTGYLLVWDQRAYWASVVADQHQRHRPGAGAVHLQVPASRARCSTTSPSRGSTPYTCSRYPAPSWR